MAGWAEAIGAGTSLAGSLIGGSQERGAVKRAGTTLANASQAEVDQIYARLREINPMLADAFNRARQSVTSTADSTGTHLEDVAGTAGERAVAAGREANTYLDPYMQTGARSTQTLADLVNAPEEKFNFQFSEDDPSYQFRFNEGQRALQKSAAARSGLQGSGTLKALMNYGQNAASQEYQKAFDRSMGTFETNQKARQQRLNSLSDLMKTGAGSAERAGLNLTGTTQYAGTLASDAAARAGDWRNRGAALEGGWDIESAKTQAGNTLTAEEQARNMRLSGAQATAESIYGSGKITGNMWAQGGRTLGDLITMSPWGRSSNYGSGGANASYNSTPYWQQVGLGQDKYR